MPFSHDEIIVSMNDDIQELSRLCEARPQRCAHLDQADDDYEFVAESLERWHDRDFKRATVETSTHLRLELEADRILQETAS